MLSRVSVFSFCALPLVVAAVHCSAEPNTRVAPEKNLGEQDVPQREPTPPQSNRPNTPAAPNGGSADASSQLPDSDVTDASASASDASKPTGEATDASAGAKDAGARTDASIAFCDLEKKFACGKITCTLGQLCKQKGPEPKSADLCINMDPTERCAICATQIASAPKAFITCPAGYPQKSSGSGVTGCKSFCE